MSKFLLIADDDENDAAAIEGTLAKAGIKNLSTTVADGVDVIAYFGGHGSYADRKQFPIPNVLLLDLKMPMIGGFAVMEWLNEHKEMQRDTLVVVLTGHGELGHVQRAYSLGARSFLTKPCTVEDVKSLVRRYPKYWETETPTELPAKSVQ